MHQLQVRELSPPYICHLPNLTPVTQILDTAMRMGTRLIYTSSIIMSEPQDLTPAIATLNNVLS